MFAHVKKLFFGKKRFQPFFRKLFAISLEGMNIGTGGGDLSHSGEAFVIRYCLGGLKNPVIFDVGAQGGEYAYEVLQVCGSSNARSASKDSVAAIFAFEPNSADFEKLQKMFANVREVTLHKLAFGDSVGRATLHSNGANGLSSFYKATEHKADRKDDTHSVQEEVEVATIDVFCKKFAIQNIDLLKLDVEGHELACLKGARQMLPKIKNIQFEMSIRSQDSHTYFKDIFEFLKDYRIYRILRDGVCEIETPDKLSELLFTTNYLAVRNVAKN